MPEAVKNSSVHVYLKYQLPFETGLMTNINAHDSRKIYYLCPFHGQGSIKVTENQIMKETRTTRMRAYLSASGERTAPRLIRSI